MNEVAKTALIDLTVSMRFPGLQNGSMRKIAVNMSPMPRLHFLVPSHAPLYLPPSLTYSSPN